MKLLARNASPDKKSFLFAEKPKAQQEIEARQEANRQAMRDEAARVTGEMAVVSEADANMGKDAAGFMRKEDANAIHHDQPLPFRPAETLPKRPTGEHSAVEVPVTDASAGAQEVPVQQNPA